MVKFKFTLLALTTLFVACKTPNFKLAQKTFVSNGYLNNCFNDSVKIGFDLYSDMYIKDTKLLKKRTLIKANRFLKNIDFNNLIAYGKSENPLYDFYIFHNKTVDSTKIEKQFLVNDSLNKKIYLLKQAKNKQFLMLMDGGKYPTDRYSNYESMLGEANGMITYVYFDTIDRKVFDISAVLTDNLNRENPFSILDKLNSNPYKQTEMNSFLNQITLTLNSTVQDNATYEKLLNDKEKTRSEKHSKIFDSLSTSSYVSGKNEVLKILDSISKTTNVLMLNEDHSKPKHRFFATLLLKTLKQNGFKYLAVEGLENETSNIEKINNEKFATSKSGFYLRESFFGHLIRTAKSLDFEIVGYESDGNNTEREIGQANNLKNILDKNPQAKIFVYAGFAHIRESSAKNDYDRMAQYFKKTTNINPITIDQSSFIPKSKENLILINQQNASTVLDKYKGTDYLLVNNMNPNLEEIYPNSVFSEQKINVTKFDNKSNEFLIYVFKDEEYGFKGIPIVLKLEKASEEIVYKLPTGNYRIKITSKTDDIYFNEVVSFK
jgi:hypothetical protein